MKTHHETILIAALISTCMACSTGSAHTQPSKHDVPVSAAMSVPQTPESSALSWSWIEPDELEERLEREETFVLVNMLEGCGNNPGTMRDLEEFTWTGPFTHAQRVPAYAMWNTFDIDPETMGPRTRAIFRSTKYASPTSFFIRRGRHVDTSAMMIFVNGFERFMARNVLSASLQDELNERGSGAELRRSLTRRIHVYRDMTGLNATGFTMKDPVFEGSDLRNADFTGATLDRPNFSHADLTGADFTQATFPRPAFWGSCTCPDGTRSEDHGLTCQGHLTPARVAGIATDEAPSPKEKKTRAFIEALRAVE